jgi:DNA-binding CsgD family transcriptional regulator
MLNRLRALAHLPAHVALLSEAGLIVEVNEPWRLFAAENGMNDERYGVGLNYVDLTARTLGEDHRLTLELKALLAGRTALLTWAYPCHSPDQQRWFNLIGVPVAAAGPARAALIHLDISSLVPLVKPGELGPETSKATLAPALQDLWPGQKLAETTRSTGLSATSPQVTREQLRSLTPRQVEILLMLGRGFTTAQIADALAASPNTVKAHTRALLKRLNLASRTQAAIAAGELVRQGITV